MCGLFGIVGNSEAAKLCYLGLFALQHRGQESAGITTVNEGKIHIRVGTGLVHDVFSEDVFDDLPGSFAIGQVRYSTAESNEIEKGNKVQARKNAQPLLVRTKYGEIALAHNGNLVGQKEKRRILEEAGAIFSSKTDTEIFLHLLARSQQDNFEAALMDALQQLSAAYCFLVQLPHALYAIRDSYGFRPLVLGKLQESYVVASETCALDLIGAEYIRDVERGEVLRITPQEAITIGRLPRGMGSAYCAFEKVYFSRPDSQVFEGSVYDARKLLGRFAAIDLGWGDAEIVVPVPDSGSVAALGFSQESKLPLEFGLIRNHYVGRSFIEPKQQIRDFGVRLKHNAVRGILANKSVLLMDDSIIRGTTMGKIVRMVRNAGARKVHVRISCPPTSGPCYYGIDTPRTGELIAARHNVAAIRELIGADTLGYLSLERMTEALLHNISTNGKKLAAEENMLCTACWTKEYPVAIPGNPWLQFQA